MLKKLLYVIFVLIFANNIGICFNENELNNIEYLKYGRCYENESLGIRLNRLETDFFGLSQSGNIDERINRLSRIAENSRQHTIALPDYNYSRKKKNIIKNILSTTSSLLDSGNVTGFTPPITQYDYADIINYQDVYCPYNYNPYLNRNFNYYSNVSLPPGYIYGNNPMSTYSYSRHYYSPPNITTRSSVHIIKD